MHRNHRTLLCPFTHFPFEGVIYALPNTKQHFDEMGKLFWMVVLCQGQLFAIGKSSWRLNTKTCIFHETGARCVGGLAINPKKCHFSSVLLMSNTLEKCSLQRAESKRLVCHLCSTTQEGFQTWTTVPPWVLQVHVLAGYIWNRAGLSIALVMHVLAARGDDCFVPLRREARL